MSHFLLLPQNLSVNAGNLNFSKPLTMAGDLLEMLAAAELGDGNLVCATLLENLSGNLAAIDIRSSELDIGAVCDCENLVKLNVYVG